MFDVRINQEEVYRESAGYQPGARAVVATTPFANLGLSICYDIRFPHLYRVMAKAGADVLLAPSAFSPITARAHWEVLLRARAIEAGAFVLAPAQCGLHKAGKGRRRETYGHSMAVSPWGEILAQAGSDPEILYFDLDRTAVDKARSRIPSLTHDRDFEGPQ